MSTGALLVHGSPFFPLKAQPLLFKQPLKAKLFLAKRLENSFAGNRFVFKKFLACCNFSVHIAYTQSEH